MRCSFLRIALWGLAVVPAPAADLLTALAPGTLVSISGTRLTLETARPPEVPIPLPTKLGETEVLVGGSPAPLLLATPQRVVFQVPYEVAPGGDMWVWLRISGVDSNPMRLDTVAATPSVFVLNGGPQGAVFLAGTLVPASADRPANGGELVDVYATGLGLSADAPPTAAVLAMVSRFAANRAVGMDQTASVPQSVEQTHAACPAPTCAYAIGVCANLRTLSSALRIAIAM
jgi:uncharacterized protein (TIGR03437 family)